MGLTVELMGILEDPNIKYPTQHTIRVNPETYSIAGLALRNLVTGVDIVVIRMCANINHMVNGIRNQEFYSRNKCGLATPENGV